jgi:hypothetical protein
MRAEVMARLADAKRVVGRAVAFLVAHRGEMSWAARRAGIYLAAPGAMMLVFLIGVLVVPSAHPRTVTWPTGPSLHAIGEPVSLEIPSLRAKAPVEPIVLTGDVLVPPANVRTIGWWTGSVQPGSPKGQTLMTGHAAHAGYSPLNHLRDIRRGATITVRSKDDKLTYVVKNVVIWSKAKIAKRSDVLFDPDYHDRRLLLVTSAGYDGKKWNANVIVFAYPI